MAMEDNGNSIIITRECFEEEPESLEFDDNLSFSNLEMQSPRNSPSSSSAYNNNNEDEFFEFSTATAPEIIPDDLNEYQKRDYLTNSFGGKEIDLEEKDGGKNLSFENDRSMSTMMMKRNSSNLRSIDQRNKKVNLTSLTSMSAKSRRRMFMFGPVKFNPEMELSALRERQSWGRIPTKLMFPVPVDVGEETTTLSVVSGSVGDGGKPVSTPRSRAGKISSHWGMLVRSFRGRSPITAALAKSLGCVMAPTGAEVEKWIRVAN